MEATGVDCLAVSFGNVHLLVHAEPRRSTSTGCAAIHARVPTCRSSSTAARASRRRRSRRRSPQGVAKFNVGTVLQARSSRLKEAVACCPPNPMSHALLGSHGPADLLDAGKATMLETVRELIRLYGGSGRAA